MIPSAASKREIAITPDQAPVAQLDVDARGPGEKMRFDASASTVTFGTISSYEWDFGDGSPTVETATPEVTHESTTAGDYTVIVTETSSAGTSTTQVFTGHAMSRNGGPSARAAVTFTVGGATAEPPPPGPIDAVPGFTG